MEISPIIVFNTAHYEAAKLVQLGEDATGVNFLNQQEADTFIGSQIINAEIKHLATIEDKARRDEAIKAFKAIAAHDDNMDKALDEAAKKLNDIEATTADSAKGEAIGRAKEAALSKLETLDKTTATTAAKAQTFITKANAEAKKIAEEEGKKNPKPLEKDIASKIYQSDLAILGTVPAELREDFINGIEAERLKDKEGVDKEYDKAGYINQLKGAASVLKQATDLSSKGTESEKAAMLQALANMFGQLMSAVTGGGASNPPLGGARGVSQRERAIRDRARQEIFFRQQDLNERRAIRVGGLRVDG